TGSLLIPTGGPLTIVNNSIAGGNTLVIGPNTVIGQIGSNTTYVLNIGGAGNTVFSGSFATSGNGVNAGMRKFGPGTLDYAGSGSALSGGLELAGGTLVLDYVTNTSTKLAGGQLQLRGGVLSLIPNAGTAVTQGFSFGTLLTDAHTDIQAS